MIILPAIDLHHGACVRLYQGDFETARQVAGDALETARNFRKAGARWLHMVDLDGAKTGGRPNRELILSVAKESGLLVELGGGIRDMAAVEDYLENGIQRVILGSAALKNPSLVREAARRFGSRVAVGIDARDGMAAAEGWLETSKVDYLTFAEQMEQAGVQTLIFTDIACDGTLSGPNFEQLGKLCEKVSCRIVASGGIRDLSHIRQLAGLGLYGAICGKSIYSGTLSLTEAIQAGGMQDAG